MELQDLLMKVAGKEETLDSDIEFGSFSWADKVLSLYDFCATIAQVLLSFINVVAIFLPLDKISIFLIKENLCINCLSEHLKEPL